MGQPACELDTVGYFHLFITHTAILALTGGDLHPDRTTTFLCNAAILVTSISGRALRALWTECLFPTNAGLHMKSAFTSFEQMSSFNLVHIRHKCGGCADFTQYCKVKRPLKCSVWYIVKCWNGIRVISSFVYYCTFTWVPAFLQGQWLCFDRLATSQLSCEASLCDIFYIKTATMEERQQAEKRQMSHRRVFEWDNTAHNFIHL